MPAGFFGQFIAEDLTRQAASRQDAFFTCRDVYIDEAVAYSRPMILTRTDLSEVQTHADLVFVTWDYERGSKFLPEIIRVTECEPEIISNYSMGAMATRQYTKLRFSGGVYGYNLLAAYWTTLAMRVGIHKIETTSFADAIIQSDSYDRDTWHHYMDNDDAYHAFRRSLRKTKFRKTGLRPTTLEMLYFENGPVRWFHRTQRNSFFINRVRQYLPGETQ